MSTKQWPLIDLKLRLGTYVSGAVSSLHTVSMIFMDFMVAKSMSRLRSYARALSIPGAFPFFGCIF